MKTTLFDLDGKIALVTGASRGIGEALARLFAQQGAHVIVSSRNQADCQTVVDSITEAGGSAEAVVCHVGDVEAIETLFAAVEKRHSHLDILVNNAAANPYFGPILETDLGAFNKTVDVNIRGYFYMSVGACRLMKGRGGVIVNTASINALKPAEWQGIYSITKAAVVSMTRAFARECGPLGIRVNALLPGLTKTRFSSALFDDDATYRRLVEQIPLGRHAAPEEMAGAALYLVSDAASYTNGECIVVDGGLTV